MIVMESMRHDAATGVTESSPVVVRVIVFYISWGL